jgi:hypothetical protein
LGNVTLVDDDSVVISDVEALQNISAIIAQQPPRILQNYMIWRLLIYRILDMPKRFRIILDQLKKAVFGITKEQSRTSLCAAYVNTNMEFAVSKLYIDKYTDKLARTEVFKVIVNISCFLHFLTVDRNS